MALNAYLKLAGETVGAIKGSVTQRGREGKIMVIAARHELVTPHDPASGLLSGRRQHHPFVITKQVDRSSPLLYAAMTRNELLTLWDLQFWRPSTAGVGAGVERQHYTVKLFRARIAGIALTMPNNNITELAKLVEYEEVAFVYDSIEWIWSDGAVSAADTWAAPTARRKPARRK